jgi:ABC-2 type transport system permease protein
LAGLIIPPHFSSEVKNRTEHITRKALTSFGLQEDSAQYAGNISVDSLVIYFNPVLQETYRYSIRGALQSILQVIENKSMIRSLYAAINQKQMPADFENEVAKQKTGFKEKFVSLNGKSLIPNATQHNVPAWTIFAMFFTVISLGGNMVKEKLSGSFTRLRILPTNYLTILFAKQFLYLCVAMLQVLVIFSLGVWLFPKINLPALNIPSDLSGLLVVSVICGWCAISYGLCIGIFANTQEQANGFGAVSVVILAAIGGIFVPSFAVPESFRLAMNFSPLYWGLESYYSLFLGTFKFNGIIKSISPLVLCILVFQALAFVGLKRKKLL